MGFKDKIVGSALNNSNIPLDALQNNVRGLEFDLSKVDPCSDKPFKSSFKDILKELLGLFTVLLPKAPFLSAAAVAEFVPGGLSAMRETAEFLEAMKAMGVPIDTYVDGTPNFFSQSMLTQTEIRNNEFIENARVTIATRPGSINIKGIGMGAAGPVDVSGFNTNYFKGEGGIR